MVKLILIELRKILNKRSIFVMMVIILGFNLLNNILFYTDYDSEGNYKYLEVENIEEEKELLEEKLSKYDYNNIDEVSVYVELKTKLDLLKIKEMYKNGSWQYNKVSDYLYNIVNDVNIYTYIIKDSDNLVISKDKLNELLERFNNNDWKYFVRNEISSLESQLLEGKDLDKVRVLEELKYRLDNNITYDNSYLNISLNKYRESCSNISYYEENIDNLSYKESIEYQRVKEELEVNKYILDNKINYNKQNNLNYQLRTIVDDYEIFVIIIILIVASGIVAEEFTSGTIKLLLIKPYSRGKILLGKYFAGIIMMFLVIIYLVVLQIIIGGYIFGFDSLDIPVIVYDFNKMKIVSYNLFTYMIIRIVVKLPLLVILYTISFSLSSIVNSVATSIVIPLFIYIFTDSIKYLILQYKINILKYLVNINWNFNNYLFGRKVDIDGIDLEFSLWIWFSYFIIIMFITFINFKNKDIKNV